MNPYSKPRRSFRMIVSVMALLAIIGAALAAHPPAQAAVAAGSSEYYLPGNANQLLLEDNEITTTLTNTTTITVGDDGVTIPMEIQCVPGAIGDYVWLDRDGDGVQDAGESGLAGVTVELYTSADALVASTRTITNGAYTFSNVTTEVNYYVRFTTPTGYSFTRQDQGGNDATDSDANPATGKTAAFYLASGATDNTRDAGLLPAPGAIGDYVWLDENGDGVQDAGEAGIPNARVTLTGANIFGNTINLTTTTDTDGKYLFGSVQAGSYTVTVVSVTLPAGLAANPTYDYDGVSTAHRAAVTLLPGQEMLQADFGYNWAPPADTDGNTGTGAIGDRLWIDDGDGMQEPGEPGLSNVSVALLTAGPDSLFGTTDDVTATITTTNAAGNYIFDGLAAGAYVVRVNGGSAPTGYTQTGDPDQPGTACTTCDNRTTTPIVLAPGDVYVNADFGYRPSGVSNTIGNQIFVDINGDGNLDSGEPGLPGVSVALLDSGGNIIATTITDANGQYSFPGLPNGTYTVWVNDTANVLGGLTQNSTPNNAVDGGQACGTCNGRNTVTVSGSGSSFQDFGYEPVGHNADKGLIGDTIYYDRDSGADYDPGEGLEGVRVDLYSDVNNNNVWDAGDVLLSSVWSSENGSYYFGGLAAGKYVVKVYTPTLPTGVTNTVDPDTASPGDNQSAVSLIIGSLINLNQDFGYRDTTNPNTIGGTLWRDTDADGLLEAAEAGRFISITVVVYTTTGNLIAMTTTNASGNYTFTNLPDGTYQVDVTDDANRLDGYWHSTGPNPGNDNNSQVEPYTVTVTGGQTNTTGDFGYYRDPAALGNFVWADTDGDGIQDGGEIGIAGVRVMLTVTYTNGTTTTLTTVTDASGFYSFGNLLLDEDYDGLGVGEPVYKISIPLNQSALAGYGLTTIDNGDERYDCDNPAGVSAQPVERVNNDTYDFGYRRTLSLGGTLWQDVVQDNVLRAGDTFLAGITVNLYDAAGTTLLITTTTDSGGNYIFNNLAAGDYVVTVPNPGVTRSVTGGPDPDDNVDNDDNGLPNGSGGVRSLPITLEPLNVSQEGSEPDTVLDGDNNRSNLTVDFGFTTSPTAVTLSDFTARTAANNSTYWLWLIAAIAMGALVVWRLKHKTA